ncbi:MAG: FGGY family carbohydrate kinase, partial [Anaerolineae bacterium]|nr:FGGY family carbohydrate kinase [Anaerolineae bacterium]
MASVTGKAVLAVDLGTSQIKAILYDVSSQQSIGYTERSTVDCKVTGLPTGWSEASPQKIVGIASDVVDELRSLASSKTEIVAITFTGAMHGILLVDDRGKPLTRLIDWQDQRVLQPNPTWGQSNLEHFRERHGDRWASLTTGCQLASGYGLLTLYWLALSDSLPEKGGWLCTIVDFVASQLTGIPLSTDYSLAASTGMFDIVNHRWCRDFLATIGVGNIELPAVYPANSEIGEWQGIKVLAPSGDHAAAVYGVMGAAHEKAHINIGTGSQVAAYSHKPYFDPRFETRPGLTGDYLLVSAGSVGGHILDSWLKMIATLHPDVVDPLTLTSLLAEAETVPVHCDGLSMQPLFSGTRANPSLRGRIDGISPTNFSRGHLTRACLTGIARE